MVGIAAIRDVMLLTVSLHASTIKASPYRAKPDLPVTVEPPTNQVAPRPVFIWTSMRKQDSGYGGSCPTAFGSDQPTKATTNLPVFTDATAGDILMDVSGSDQPTKATTNLPAFTDATTGDPMLSDETTNYSQTDSGAVTLPTPAVVETTALVSRAVSGKPDSSLLGRDDHRKETPWSAEGYLPGCDETLKLACETTGNPALIDSVGKYATDTCAAFVQNLPGGSAKDTKWSRFAVPQVFDSNGEKRVFNYRWKRLSANSPQLSQGICEEAYRQMSTVFCAGEKQTTRGGTLQVAGDAGYMIGIDIDTMDRYKADDGQYNNVGRPLDMSHIKPGV